MATLWVVQHTLEEGPGFLVEEARRRGIDVELRRIDRGEPVWLPEELDGAAGLLVLGGPMGVGDSTEHPCLLDEMRLLAAAVARQLPTLGICLGAQLMASALGARVHRGEAGLELGLASVELTDAGCSNPLLGPASALVGQGRHFPVVQWHGDTFNLPADAVALARSARYPNQAFRAGPWAYALQFHLELDEPMARDWAPLLPPGYVIDEPGRQRVERLGRALLGRWLDVVAGVG